MEYAKAILSSYFRIGDEVIMMMDEETRRWGRKGPPDGTKGIVVGFYEYFQTYNYNEGKNPGIYRGNGCPLVKWESGEAEYVSYSALPKDLLEERKKDYDYKKIFDERVKLHNLPEFDYMVGNKVFTTTFPNELCEIRSIQFEKIIDTHTGELFPIEKWIHDRIFNVNIETGGSTFTSFYEIKELVEKGNYWAYLNDKSQMKFKDLREKCNFYSSLGKATQLINPNTKNYKWSIKEALEAIENGEGDLLGTSLALFGAIPWPVVYKLDDDLSELAAQSRAEILKGFSK